MRTLRMVAARKLGTHTFQDWQDKLAAHGYACTYCGRTDVQLSKDHVVPVSTGGSDHIDNIVPACRSCNSSKHARDVAVWLSNRASQTR